MVYNSHMKADASSSVFDINDGMVLNFIDSLEHRLKFGLYYRYYNNVVFLAKHIRMWPIAYCMTDKIRYLVG